MCFIQCVTLMAHIWDKGIKEEVATPSTEEKIRAATKNVS